MNEIAQPTAAVCAIVLRTHVLQILEGPFHIISKYFWCHEMHSAQTFVWIVEFVGKEIFALSIPSSKNTKLSVAMPHVGNQDVCTSHVGKVKV